MIGLAQSCKGGTALANYVMQDEKGYELCRNNLCGEAPTELLQEMQIIQDLNQKATNKTFSMVISPEKEDGKSLTDKDLESITKDFMNKLGVDPEEQQFIAFVHTEKEHKHIHIIANRVKADGTLIKDSHIGKRAQWVGHEVAKERGLVSAKERMIEKIRTIELEKDTDRLIKNQIFKKHQYVMKQNPQSMEGYMKMMKKLNVEIQPTINKQGKIQGHRMLDLATGKNFKASEINRKLGLNNLMKQGLPFKGKVELTNALAKIQPIAMRVVKKMVKEVIKHSMGRGGMSY